MFVGVYCIIFWSFLFVYCIVSICCVCLCVFVKFLQSYCCVIKKCVPLKVLGVFFVHNITMFLYHDRCIVHDILYCCMLFCFRFLFFVVLRPNEIH